MTSFFLENFYQLLWLCFHIKMDFEPKPGSSVTIWAEGFGLVGEIFLCLEETFRSVTNHRTIEWPGLKRTTMIIEFQPPRYVQGRQPADQAAQSHIQPGLECLQGWGIHSLLGQPVQCVTTLWVKNFFLISNLNLPCPSLKLFPLVLSLSTLVNNPPVYTLQCRPLCEASNQAGAQW